MNDHYVEANARAVPALKKLLIALIIVGLGFAIYGGIKNVDIDGKFDNLTHTILADIDFAKKKVAEEHSKIVHDGYVKMLNEYETAAKCIITYHNRKSSVIKADALIHHNKANKLWAKYSVLEQDEGIMCNIANAVYGTNSIIMEN